MFTPWLEPLDAATTQAVSATAEPASLLGAEGPARGQGGMAFQPPYSPSLFRRRDW